MLPQHVDVDIPAALLPQVGTLLEDLNSFVKRRGLPFYTLMKE